MSEFVSKSVRFSGQFSVAGSIENVFILFSPLGEKMWVPDWNPELIYPPDGDWAEGMIFRTIETSGEAIWLVRKLDTKARYVEYYRIEPGEYVARIEVRCLYVDDNTTTVETIYEFIGLSQTGNSEITSMSQDSYDRKMERWAGWIGDYLASIA